MKMLKTLSQDTRSLGQDLKSGTTEYEGHSIKYQT